MKFSSAACCTALGLISVTPIFTFDSNKERGDKKAHALELLKEMGLNEDEAGRRVLKPGILKFFRNLVFLTFFEYLIRYRKVKKEAVREMAVEGEKDYGRNYRTKGICG